MTPEIQTLVRDFSVGAVDEGRRLEMERLLLTDTEVLLDYLEIKRERESAAAIPKHPSEALWARLQLQVAPRKKAITFSVAGVLAFGLVLFFVFSSRSKAPPPLGSSGQVLFDSRRELPVNSDVL